MFKIEPNPSFWATVEIHVPGEGPAKFEAEYRFLDRAESQVYFESLNNKTNIEALDEILLDWRGINAPFSKDNLLKLLDNYSTAAPGFYKAYLAEITGTADKPGVAEKN